MGQPQSSEGGRNNSRNNQNEESVPYTRYSQPKPSNEKIIPSSTVKGITVVNPKPDHDLRRNKPLELQKMDKIHRFWPIRKSSLQHAQPTEKITDGLEYKDVLHMCIRYQEHLHETAAMVSIEQRALTSRLKDLEMFSAGIAQQMLRRQERMQRALAQLEKVKEVSNTLDAIHSSIEQCVPVLVKLNQLLPEKERLEPFVLHPLPLPQPQIDEEGGDGGGGEEKGLQDSVDDVS